MMDQEFNEFNGDRDNDYVDEFNGDRDDDYIEDVESSASDSIDINNLYSLSLTDDECEEIEQVVVDILESTGLAKTKSYRYIDVDVVGDKGDYKLVRIFIEFEGPLDSMGNGGIFNRLKTWVLHQDRVSENVYNMTLDYKLYKRTQQNY